MKLSIQPLSQRDERWKLKRLGFSTLTLGGYGCVVVCLSMICQYFGKDTDPAKLNEALKSVKGFSGGLIIWNKLSEVYPDIKLEKIIECPTTHAPMSEVDYWLLEKKCPVIVWVDFNPDQAIQQHFVLIVGKDEQGNYLINDPWTGETYYLHAKYPPSAKLSILGLRIYSGKTHEEKVYTEEEMTEIRLERDNNWNLYQNTLKEIENVKKTNIKLTSDLVKLKGQIANLSKTISSMAEEDHDSALAELKMSKELEEAVRGMEVALSENKRLTDVLARLQMGENAELSGMDMIIAGIKRLLGRG